MFANYYLDTNHLASQIRSGKQQIDANVMGHVILLEQDYALWLTPTSYKDLCKKPHSETSYGHG